MLVKSRWHYSRSSSVPKLLDWLGIEYRKVEKQPFWEANRGHLAAIYSELQLEARSRMRDLHPDTGGDAGEFDAFIQRFNRAKIQFAREGVRFLIETSNILSANRDTFRFPARAIEVMRLIQGGFSNREIARKAKASPAFIRKARSRMNGPKKCGCGKSVIHKGWCAFKVVRYPRWQEFLKSKIQLLPQNISGPPGCRLPKSEEHRKKISEGNRAYRKKISD